MKDKKITMFSQFFGCNQDGDTFFVDFKNHDEFQDAYFILKLKDGRCLTIPGKIYAC